MLYISVEMVAEVAARNGKGALLVKVDIESAYRRITVHPCDQPLLGMQWKGDVYIDQMLPFGLRSAPTIFSALADALEWHVYQQGVQEIFQYLDDFIVLGAPMSQQCANALSTLVTECSTLGVHIAEHKTKDPTIFVVYLGIEINTCALVLHLPKEKLLCLRARLDEWRNCKACLWKELESLIGLLNHACKVYSKVRPLLFEVDD